MHPPFKMAVALYDVAEPADSSVARVAIGAFSEGEMELVRGADGWAFAWGLLPQWPEETGYAAWPAALRAARAPGPQRGVPGNAAGAGSTRPGGGSSLG